MLSPVDTVDFRSPLHLARTVLLAFDTRWDLEEMKMRKDDENSPAGRAVMDHALAWSRNVFEAQVLSQSCGTLDCISLKLRLESAKYIGSLFALWLKRSYHMCTIPYLLLTCACSYVPRFPVSSQFDDLDSALVASVDHMEQSNLSSLQAASRDSELVVLQV